MKIYDENLRKRRICKKDKRNVKEGRKREQVIEREGSQEEERRFKLVYWNVARISNKNEEFWKYIRKFDVINLTEIWTEEGN